MATGLDTFDPGRKNDNLLFPDTTETSQTVTPLTPKQTIPNIVNPTLPNPVFPTTPVPKQPAPPAVGPAIPPTTPTTGNTDGFAQPGFTRAGTAAVPAGWDATKWNDQTHQTPKYVVGRILSNYPDNPGGLQSALGDIQKAYPGTQLIGDDKLMIPGVGIVDVGVSFGSGGGHGWAWQEQQTNAGAPVQVPTSAQGQSGIDPSIIAALTKLFATRPTPVTTPTPSSATTSTAPPASTPPPTTGGTTTSQGQNGFVPAGSTTGSATTTTFNPSLPISPTNPDPRQGQPVPGQPGYVYNWAGGTEPIGNGGVYGSMVVTPDTSHGYDGGPGYVPPTVPTNATTNASSGTASDTTGLGPENSGLDDPATARLLKYIETILPGLITPVNDPARGQLANAAQAQVQNLQTPLPVPQGTQQYQDVINRLVQQLSGPAYTDEQLAQIRTGAFDTLNHQEQMAIDSYLRTAAAHGLSPDSGIVQSEIAKIKNQYVAARGQQQQQLNSAFIDADTARRGQLLSTAQAGSNVGLGLQQTQEQRLASILPILSSLVNANTGYRAEDQANQNKALSLLTLPVDITQQRISNAVNASSGQASNPASILNTLTQYLSGAQNQANANNAQSAAYWQQLGSLLQNIDWTKVFG